MPVRPHRQQIGRHLFGVPDDLFRGCAFLDDDLQRHTDAGHRLGEATDIVLKLPRINSRLKRYDRRTGQRDGRNRYVIHVQDSNLRTAPFCERDGIFECVARGV